MKNISIVKRYSSAKPIDIVDNPEWLEGLLRKPAEKDIVLRVTNKHLNGPRSEKLREIIFYPGHVESLVQDSVGAYILIGSERVGSVSFNLDEQIATYYESGRWPKTFDNTYEKPLGSIRYKHRIDFNYNNPAHNEFEKGLLYHPTIAEVTEHRHLGYHANPKREKDVLRKYMDNPSSRHEAAAVLKYAADLEKKDGVKVVVEPRARFVGITNISPHGYLVGEMEFKRPDVLPETSILRAGDIIVSLFGGNSQKNALGSIGKVAIVDKDHAPCFINQTMASMRAKPDIDPYFLLASIRAEYFRRQMHMRMKPSNKTQTLISLEDFCECRIKIPNKVVMKKIGDRYRELMDAFKDEQKILGAVEAI